MVGEDLNVVAQLAKCCRCRTCGQAGAHNEDGELTAVQWRHKFHVVLVVVPHVLHRNAVWLVGFQDATGRNTVNNRLRVREIWVLAQEFSISHGVIQTFLSVLVPS